ncbi:hypothetical protein [Halobacillus salinus]|uniref:hypothetical protein n=1 Tax=Halobacillus salinus TaxID=192814 RepID=UPI0009A7CA51|nr:hypothetical protein [Halobacillus salinus]
MEHLLTCTTEELALMMAVSDQPKMARGMMDESFGKKTEREWIAIMEAMSHQLIMKRMWDPEKEKNDENPLNEEVRSFIDKYVHSERMIRCSNLPMQSVLMLHHYEGDQWLFHVIDRDIVHEFALLESSEIKATIRDFYGIEYESYAGEQTFDLTYRDFDRLRDPKKVDKIQRKTPFTESEEHSFELFTEDLKRFDWTLFNISNFSIHSREDQSFAENILFFLPSHRGIWISEHQEEQDRPAHFYLADYEEWDTILQGIQDFVELQTQEA